MRTWMSDDGRCTLFHADNMRVLPSLDGVSLFLTSPPYNKGAARDLNGCDFAGATGYRDNLPEREYVAGQRAFLSLCAGLLTQNGNLVYNHMHCYKKRKLLLPSRLFPDNLELWKEIVWDKFTTHNHSQSNVWPTSERLYVFRRPGAQSHFANHPPCWRPSSKAKGMGDVWQMPREKLPLEYHHCAPFPLALARQVVKMYCPERGLVCDPYSGSGTTMIAAWLEGRTFVGCETNVDYFKKSINRFLAKSGRRGGFVRKAV